MSELKECPILSFSPLTNRIADSCDNCPNRQPSKVERELREELSECYALLSRYLNETPHGNQPHMIVHTAEACVEKVGELLNGKDTVKNG